MADGDYSDAHRARDQLHAEVAGDGLALTVPGRWSVFVEHKPVMPTWRMAHGATIAPEDLEFQTVVSLLPGAPGE